MTTAPRTPPKKAMKERRDHLRQSDSLFRQLASNIPQALWIREIGSGTLRYINPTWGKMTGRPIAAGDSAEKLYEAFELSDAQRRLLHSTQSSGGGADFECQLVSDTPHWAHIRTFPVGNSDGEEFLIAGLMEDITARREESKRVEQLKDDFVSTVSHELRTPLTSISGSLGLLVGNAAWKLPKPAERLLAIAYANSQRLVRLVNDILDIEKIESGKVLFTLKRVKVRALVKQAIDTIRGFAEGYDVQISLDPASADCEVSTDPDRLVQVITNLLSNAVKFSPSEGEVKVAIQIRSDSVKITVRDDGPGIPDEFKPHVFEKFGQADVSDARQKGGTGLGLSIVKEIMTRLGGTVGFGDAPGGGTIFEIEFPVSSPLTATESGLQCGAPDAYILLCGYRPEVAVVLCDRLKQVGIGADIAYTADAAIALAGVKSYAAVLVDLQLLNGGCIELIKYLRAKPQFYDTPVVAVSADPDKAGEEEVPPTLLNILDWLEKPVDVDSLLRVIERPIVRKGGARPRILHFDNDSEVLKTVAEALDGVADVTPVVSLELARRALSTNEFDAVVLDLALTGAGTDLLPQLQNGEGEAIPVILFSALGANPLLAPDMQAKLVNFRTSLDNLVAALRKRLGVNAGSAPSQKDAA
jgi:signal transduction histidine kinase/DNA-binding response OmpR family regulator